MRDSAEVNLPVISQQSRTEFGISSRLLKSRFLPCAATAGSNILLPENFRYERIDLFRPNVGRNVMPVSVIDNDAGFPAML